MTDEERKAQLDEHLEYFVVNSGYRVESKSDYSAVIVKGRRPNHLLHLVLTILTAGLWLFVWIGVAVFGGERRKVIQV
jgi:hypothetical protein